MNNIWWLFWGLGGHCWPALPCPLNLASAAESTASALVQCSASALVLCTASAVTRAIYRHSLSIGNKTSAGCLAARCMVQNDPFWCSLQNVFKNSLIFKTFPFQLSFLKRQKISLQENCTSKTEFSTPLHWHGLSNSIIIALEILSSIEQKRRNSGLKFE